MFPEKLQMEHPFLTHSPEPLITVLLLPFLWMTLQTSQWSQILQIKFCRKQSAYVVLSNDKYAGNFHNANCLHIIHKGALSKPNWKVPILLSFYRLPVPASFWLIRSYLVTSLLIFPLLVHYVSALSFIWQCYCTKKSINSIDSFINTYVLFLCILYNFSYTVMKFSKSFHFHFNMIFFCQSILFQQLFYFIFWNLSFIYCIFVNHIHFPVLLLCNFPLVPFHLVPLSK